MLELLPATLVGQGRVEDAPRRLAVALRERALLLSRRSEGQYDLMSVAALLTYGRVLLAVILAAVAIVMLANRLRDRKPPPRNENPPPVVF